MPYGVSVVIVAAIIIITINLWLIDYEHTVSTKDSSVKKKFGYIYVFVSMKAWNKFSYENWFLKKISFFLHKIYLCRMKIEIENMYNLWSLTIDLNKIIITVVFACIILFENGFAKKKSINHQSQYSQQHSFNKSLLDFHIFFKHFFTTKMQIKFPLFQCARQICQSIDRLSLLWMSSGCWIFPGNFQIAEIFRFFPYNSNYFD